MQIITCATWPVPQKYYWYKVHMKNLLHDLEEYDTLAVSWKTSLWDKLSYTFRTNILINPIQTWSMSGMKFWDL